MASKKLKEEFDEIAGSIEKIARLGEDIFRSKLKDKAIVYLVSKASGVNQTDVTKVLEILPELKAKFLKPE